MSCTSVQVFMIINCIHTVGVVYMSV